MMFGGVEAGGTKFICVTGSSAQHVDSEARFPTRTPEETLAAATAFFSNFVSSGGRLDAVGIASFGPVELRRSNPEYGFIKSTPKPGWSHTDIAGRFHKGLGLPVGFDTDVNGAALGEGRAGAARGLSTFVYMTVGTGIGAGAVINGEVAHGLVHAEMGHVVVPRLPGDDYPGGCGFHSDCLEGMASGPALAARWGRPAEELSGGDLRDAVELEAFYLAAGLRNVIYTIAPERIVLGGGVSQMPGLLTRTRARLQETLAGYPGLAEHEASDFVLGAALGGRAGATGALVLAEMATREA
ncbi:MAG TPA: ROK family protein [Actinomycetota bacterium]|nr:ROK family protein [Actinomycetota bacterium]